MDIDVVIVVAMVTFLCSVTLGMCLMLIPYCALQKENDELKRKLEELVQLEDMSAQAFQAMMWEATHSYQSAQSKSDPQVSPSQAPERPEVNGKTHI